MRSVMRLLLFAACFSASLAQAECAYVSPKLAKTEALAQARAHALSGSQKAFACSLGERYGQPMWWCEQEKGECRLGQAAESLYYYGATHGLTPQGEDWYETWPSGQRVYCDHAYGCRPLH